MVVIFLSSQRTFLPVMPLQWVRNLGGHFILTTDNVVFVDAATLGTAHGEVGYAPDNVVGDCLGLEGGGTCGG